MKLIGCIIMYGALMGFMGPHPNKTAFTAMALIGAVIFGLAFFLVWLKKDI